MISDVVNNENELIFSTRMTDSFHVINVLFILVLCKENTNSFLAMPRDPICHMQVSQLLLILRWFQLQIVIMCSTDDFS